MLFVTYGHRVRQTCVSAIAGGAARPPRPSPSHDRAAGDERSAPRSSSLNGLASLPTIYDRTPTPVSTGNEHRADR